MYCIYYVSSVLICICTIDEDFRAIIIHTDMLEPHKHSPPQFNMVFQSICSIHR